MFHLRRTAAIVLALVSLLAVSALPATAATGTMSIGDAGADGELASGFSRFVSGDGVPEAWTTSPGCSVGGFEDPGPGDDERRTESRFALEFPLGALPDDATITSAALGLAGQGDNLQTAIYGYAGDGSITSPDVEVTGTPVLFMPGPFDIVREFHDVTGLVTAEVTAAGWAGFSVRQEPLGPNQPYNFDCPDDPLFPILTIEYSVPDPEPTPAATPAAVELPNTAADPVGPNNAIVPIALGALIAATLVWTTGRSRAGGKRQVSKPD